MTSRKDKNGEELPLVFTFCLGGSGRREMKALVRMTALDDEQEKRFDDRVDNLLREMIRAQIKES